VDYHTGALFLRDDLVAAALRDLPPGVLLTLFMDCCHCGTISRFAPALRGETAGRDRVRYLPLTAELIQATRAFRRGMRSRAGAAGPIEMSAPGVIHLAACRDHEFAWESDGQGDFTAAALALLAEAAGRGDTNEAFIAEVGKVVARKGRQQPMMMAAAAGMSGRRLLAPLAAGIGPAGAGPTAPSRTRDSELLRHLEAAVELLRQRE
jgi:hypothetical protein